MKKSNIQIVLLAVILFLQVVFTWKAYRIGNSVSSGNILTILGWIIIASAGYYQMRVNIRSQRKIDVYSKLIEFKDSLDKDFAYDLVVNIAFNIFAEFENYDEFEEYDKKLTSKISKAYWSYDRFNSCFRNWLFLMPSLEKAGYILSEEFNKFMVECREFSELITNYRLGFGLRRAGQDRVQIDTRDIIKKQAQIRNSSVIIINFIDDFLELISDELTYPIFHHRIRRGIENLKEGTPIERLTKKGIVKIPYKPTNIQREKQKEL